MMLARCQSSRLFIKNENYSTMKTLLTSLFMMCALVVAAQTSVQISNIDCTDGDPGTLSFDITWTEDGTPVNIASSGLSITDAVTNNFLWSSSRFDATEPASQTTDGFFSSALDDDNECSDVIGQSVILSNSNGTSTEVIFQEGAIPTMGQWALMILGLIMTSLGLVYIKKRATA